MSESVRIYEVSLRDGLQNEAGVVSTDDKVELAHRLVRAGFRDIEIASFVSPRRVPQMADAADVVRRLASLEDVALWVLVPNSIGLDRALDAGVENVATFMSASETHNKKNVNRTIRESLAGLTKVIERARSEELRVRSYISTVFGCPYEGEVAAERTVAIAQALLDAGATEIALGDTTGMGHPEQVKRVIGKLVESGVPLSCLAVHFHDTRGTAVVNAYAAWQEGIRAFDGSIGGIGGCPYAPGATGNASTEDLVHLFQRLDEQTGIDLDLACEAGEFMQRVLGRPLQGRFQQYWQASRARAAQRSSTSRTA